jgi:hypothetical protein
MALIALSQRGVTDDGDESLLGPNELVFMPGKKSSLSSAFRLWKLWLDDIVFNAHVSLLTQQLAAGTLVPGHSKLVA